MLRRSASPLLALLVVIFLIFQCDLPQDPTDPSNTRVELLVRDSRGLQGTSSITDTVNNPIRIGLAFYLPTYIDSIKFTVKAEGKAIYDTMLRSFSTQIKDTIWKSMSFPDSGYKLVTIVPYSHNVTLLPASADIMIVKKTSTTQPGNHPPKWLDSTLNVDLNDTARYELNLAPLCSDPDKDVVRFAISGKTLPGDAIIDSIYKFQASAATIGKNSIDLIASDPSGLKDTMELVLNVTASGTDTNPPKVTILTPDRDSSVTDSENYVFDLLCSDASGIDSVYAVFNGNKTSAVLVNGHYKISITGLVAGVYNVIQLTVRDKSTAALKTTKTIKIKYVKSFTIAYNGNGNPSGEVPIDTGKYETGAAVTVKGNTGNLVKTGFTFAGWNTAADGSGTAYAAGSTFIIGTGNVTLFARWTQNPTFTVIYDGNINTTGTAPSDSGKYETGTSVTVKGNSGNLIKTGFTFAGWNTTADGSGTAYAAGSTFNMGTGNVTLYARWTTNPTFTVTYNANAGSGAVPADSNKYETGVLVTVLGSSALVKTGYTFIGWNTAADGSGTSRAATTTFNMSAANIILYAQWKLKQYSVMYDANDASTGNPPSDATKHDTGTTVTVAGNTGGLVKIGCIFSGWNTAADGKGTTYAAGTGSFVITGDTKLFAQWTLKKYKLSYSGNGNTGGAVPDETSYDSNATVSVSGNINGLTKTGFDFTGWNTSANGSGVTYTAASTFRIKSDTTLFAQWTIKKYKLTIVPPVNGAVNLSGEVNVDSSVATTITATAASGFKFKYWKVTGGSAKITDTASASTTVLLTQGNASIKAVFGCLTFDKTISFSEYKWIGNPSMAIGSDGTYYVAFECSKTDSYVMPAIMKLDLNGNEVWKQEYSNGSLPVRVGSIRKTSEGCFLLSGTESPNREQSYMRIWKIASNKNEIIQLYVDNGIGKFAFETSDGGFVIGGASTGGTAIKTNSTNADKLWKNSYDGVGILLDGQETADGGYIFVGGESYFTITKTDNNGTVTWQKLFGADYSDGCSIRQTTDGGYIIGGQGGSYFATHSCGLIKITANGSTEWQKINSSGDKIVAVRQTADGGYVYVGNTRLGSGGGYDIYLVKTNSTGDIIWSRTFGTDLDELAFGLEVSNDGGFLITGASESSSQSVVIIIKTDENGEVERR